MTRMNNNEVKNIAECNVLHEKINPPKRAKSLNNHYSYYTCMYEYQKR